MRRYPIPKTGDSPERSEKSNRQARSQTAITAPKKRSRTKKAKPMASAQADVTPRTTHSEIQPCLQLRELDQLTRKSKTQSFQEKLANKPAVLNLVL